MRTRNSNRDAEIDIDDENEEQNDNNVNELLGNPRKILSYAASYTEPNVSLVFIALLAAGAFFHEQYFSQTMIAMGLWFLIQFVNSLLTEDYQTTLFWSIFGTIWHLAIYIGIGHVWSYAKLWIEIRQKHLPAEVMTQLASCEDFSCFANFLLTMKWSLGQWTLTWPMSALYTLSRDPLHIATNLLFEWSQRRYIAIIQSALGTQPANGWTLGWMFLCIVGYFVLGYIWTHAKLFLDVWQGTLPKTLDEEVRAVYENNASYWQFIYKMKYVVLQWMVIWPFSFTFTIMRHPVRMFFDWIYYMSQKKYIWITVKAMDLRNKQQKEE